jgi:hypothetical protein
VTVVNGRPRKLWPGIPFDNRGLTRPVRGEPRRPPASTSNVRAGGQACPIRYQCAGWAHLESDPSYLPELRAHADDLRREREVILAAGAADWVSVA